MKSLVVGNGQIGKAVSDVICRNDTVVIYDRNGGEPPLIGQIDILHVCFPCHKVDEFINNVNFYISMYKPMHVIIWSTLPIGTTKKIRGAVHSPVEGRHPKLASSIRSMTRWVGINHPAEVEFYEDYFIKLQLRVRIVPDSDFTEFLKLRSTSKYGINLVWTDYEKSVANEIGMNFELIKEFDKDYNKLYHNLGIDWAQRYILDPPRGHIGGHCVVPNAKLLDEQYPSELLKMIKAMK